MDTLQLKLELGESAHQQTDKQTVKAFSLGAVSGGCGEMRHVYNILFSNSFSFIFLFRIFLHLRNATPFCVCER